MNAIGAISGIARPAAPEPRLVQAAHEFEAQLMKELLKPMTAGADLDGDESEAGGALGEFATDALGQGLSRHGGLGIATNIIRSLSRNEKASPDSPDLGSQTMIPGKHMAAELKKS